MTPPSTPLLRNLAAGFLLTSLLALPITAQVPFDGGEQINTWTTGNQSSVDVARGSDGGFFVVWDSPTSDGTDSDGHSVRGRVFDADGLPLGDDFQINTYTSHDQEHPAVAAAPNGDFLVVWQSGDPNTLFTDRTISAQRYASDGTPQAGEFQVRLVTDTYLDYPVVVSQPDVAFHSNGDFMVVWEHRSTTTIVLPDVTTSIEGRGFSADGTPQGDAVSLASALCNHLLEPCNRVLQPAVVDDPAGHFAVVWSEKTYIDFVEEFRLRLQRVNVGAHPVGDLFRVSTFNGFNLDHPAIARSGSEMMVVWESDNVDDPDTDSTTIRGRRLGADGSPLGPEFQVNVLSAQSQRHPSVSADASLLASFAVAWQDGEGNNDDIFVRRFGHGGEPFGGFENLTEGVNDSTRQGAPALAPGFAAWISDTSQGSDTSLGSVHGRRLSPPADLDLRGWWQGDGAAPGTTAADSSGNGNDGMLLGGATFDEGPFAGALLFDGVNDNVNVPHDASLDFGQGNFAFSFWIQTLSAEAGILSLETVPQTAGFTVYLDDGFPAVRIDSASESTQLVCNQVDISDGAVHHVVVSGRRVSAGPSTGLHLDIYVDGLSRCGAFDALNTGSSDNGSSLRLGADLDHAFLAGTLDSVRIYGRALDAAEVEGLYRSFSGLLFADGFESGGVGQWSAGTP